MYQKSETNYLITRLAVEDYSFIIWLGVLVTAKLSCLFLKYSNVFIDP